MIMLALALAFQSEPLRQPDSPPDTYISAQDTILPDPEHLQSRPWSADTEELRIATEINHKLDTWRMCGWNGSERAAAIFNTWARTHLAGDPTNAGHVQIAWKPYGRNSAINLAFYENATYRNEVCNDLVENRPQLQASMERLTDDLMHAHDIAHTH